MDRRTFIIIERLSTKDLNLHNKFEHAKIINYEN